MAGYSGTPLAKKLGIVAGSRIFLSDAPKNYLDLVAPLPEGVQVERKIHGETDIVHIFSTERARLKATLQSSLTKLRQDGSIWVSWPKKASKVPTDITEDTNKRSGLADGSRRHQGLRGRRHLVGVEAGSEKEEPDPMKIKPDHRRALAHLKRRDWDKAHAIVMGMRDKLAFRIHGLLHRIEGDLDNARYWYGRAGVPFGKSAASEIEEIAAVLATSPRAAAATRTGTRRSPQKRSGSRRSRA